MKPLPRTTAWLSFAKRIIWFKAPEDALSNPLELTAYTLRQGTEDDVRFLLRQIGYHGLRDALQHAPPGILDPRSWSLWNLVAGFNPALPLPKRFS